MKKLFSCSALLLAILLTVGCAAADPEILVETETMKIERSGAVTVVYDLTGEEEYSFTAKRVRRSEGQTEPHRAIDTETVQIDTLPKGGLRVSDLTAGQTYTISRKGW